MWLSVESKERLSESLVSIEDSKGLVIILIVLSLLPVFQEVEEYHTLIIDLLLEVIGNHLLMNYKELLYLLMKRV